MRKAHILKSNRNSEFPAHCIFFDVESELIMSNDKIIHKPYLIVSCYVNFETDYEDWQTFTNPQEFWIYVDTKTQKKRKTVLFAHNITYDLISSGGFRTLQERCYKITNYYEKGRVFILEMNNVEQSKKLLLLNTGNFYSGGVADIGKMFGIPKMEMDFNNPTLEQAIPYCKNDVLIIKTAMTSWFKFCQDEDLGGFARTVPSQAMNAFKHRFMTHPIYLHSNNKVFELERGCYYGGRVECYRLGKFDGKYYYVDVNSMYPFVMLTKEYPVRLVSYRKKPSFDYIRLLIAEGYLLCCKAIVNVDIPFSYIPLRYDKKIIFPIGRFETFMTTPEIIKALDDGIIESFLEVSFYEKVNIFESYVNFFFNKKQEAKQNNDIEKQMLYKLFLNSLYGKFGQKGGGWSICSETDREGSGYERVYFDDIEQEGSFKWFNNIMFKLLPETESYNSFCAIAAHVTAYARLYLYDIIVKAGFKNVLYTDTDSIFVNEVGYNNIINMIDKYKLGYLSLEMMSENGITLYAPKDYVFDEKVRHKGVPEKARRINENTWEITLFPKLSTFIRANNVNQYFNVNMQKTLKRQYNKGKVQESDVIPFEFTYQEGKNCLIT